MSQAQLSSARPLPGPAAESARVSSECAHHASFSLRGIGDVGCAGAASRCGSSGSQNTHNKSSAVQKPMSRQSTHTSYAVHRVLPRILHPHFTSNAQHPFPKHHISKSGFSTDVRRPSEHLLRTDSSFLPSPHSSPIFGAADVAKFVLYTPRRAVETTGVSPKGKNVRDDDVVPPLRDRKDLQRALPSSTQPNRTRATLLRTLLPARGADIAVTPPTPAFSPSQLEQDSDPLVGAAMQQRGSQALPASTPVPASLLCSGNGGKESEATASPIFSAISPRPRQSTHCHDNQPSAAAFSKAATSGGYSRRDIQRGTWVSVLARQECLARELLGTEETSEALRYLPASCAVWRAYYRHTSASAEHGTAHVASSTDTDAPPPSQASIASTATSVASSESPSAAGDADAFYAAAGGASSPHGGDVDREDENTRKPLMPPQSHPAFATAVRRMELLEDIHRGELTAEEGDAFHLYLAKPFVYEHRLLTVGTLPLEQFLRQWIAITRARKQLRTRQRTKVEVLEQTARAALHATSETLQRRFRLLMTALVQQEHHHRCALELLHTQAAGWTGVVLLRLQEQVERFPFEFGAVMSHTRVCGRVVGLTLFSNLVRSEQVGRGAIRDEEARLRVAFPIEFEARVMGIVHEPQTRKELADREACERAVLHQVVSALQTHYSLREVEIEEGIDRQSWMREPMHGGVDSVLASATP
ncbi:hypothetical protein GH5_02495 [Leishmania sp. Ghana 2012 LV757]|uniref:hypothetical protein n=1 Tax=Leishmania sp. Ghana 2012 LV757 TaxID=2803181 RepID=UPI001B478543|nr:hypothetical protein GH5_02495 [Leishmania sp. Ghana 2012 LV757]